MTQTAQSPPPHGTVSTYTNHHCRCRKCKKALAVYTQAQREYRRRRPIPDTVVHGNSCYRNWGCRCETCTAGARRADRGRVR